MSLVFLRSEIASGEAAGIDGVAGVFVGTDVEKLGHVMVNQLLPNMRPTEVPLLACPKIESVGQILVAIAASNANVARDALERVTMQVENRPLRHQNLSDR